jgi:hypothetical protein
VVPFIPKRPSSLSHLSDEVAARVLSEHFGDIIAAARDLGVDRKDLRRLTWHNPDILRPAHERIWFFILRRKSDLTRALLHGGADARRRAGERLLHAEATPGDPLNCGYGYSTLAFLTPADRRSRASIEAEKAARIAAEQAGKLRLAVEEAVAAERAREAEADRQRELELERAREGAAARWRELETIPAGRSSAPPAQGGSLWPAGIRRPSRGGWR